MQTGENRALRWLVREREGQPVPLNLYCPGDERPEDEFPWR